MSKVQEKRKPTRGKFIQYNPKGTEDLDHWRNVFIAMSDPTEYAPALELAGSWPEWCRMKKDWKEFADVILISWLAEVEVKLRSDAVRQLCAQAAGPQGAVSAKWIAEGRYNPTKAGRPSKYEIEKQAKIEARIADEVGDDIARVHEALGTERMRIISNG